MFQNLKGETSDRINFIIIKTGQHIGKGNN